MIWFIFVAIFVALAISCFVGCAKCKDESASGGALLIGLMCTAIAIIVSCSVMHNVVKWQAKANVYSYLDVMIQNKLDKIEMMKQSYREIAAGSEVNIDLVNKDLTQSIAQEVRDLEEYINGKNVELAKWKVSRRYWLWNACMTDPPIEGPILMPITNAQSTKTEK